MSSMDYFDATNIPPSQGGGGHPAGMYNFLITNTYGKPTKDGRNAMLVVELTSEAGKIENRYNLFHSSAQAVEIAKKELSALCHAVGIFKMSFPKLPDGSPNVAMFASELRGGRGRMEVAPQDPTKPDSYMEVKKVFDINGNEPGRSAGAPVASAPSGTMGQPAPAAQGWGQGAANPAPNAAAPAPQGWGAPPQQAQQQAPVQQQAPQGAAPNAPPWANR